MEKKTTIVKKGACICLALVMLLTLAACSNRNSSGSGGNTEVYQEYLLGIMDANYKGEFDSYIEMTGASYSDAKSVYDANVRELALNMEEALSMDTSAVTADITERLEDIAILMYEGTDYESVDVVRDGDTYTITLDIKPVDFFGTVLDTFSNAIDSFNERAKAGEFDDMSDTEYEREYADAIVSSLEKRIKKVTYASAVSVDVTLDYDEDDNVYGISDEQMEMLDGLVVSMN